MDYPNYSREQREAFRIEGLAVGMYEMHAALTAKRTGVHTPKWAWLTEEQRNGWYVLALERIADTEAPSFNQDVVEGWV